MNTVQWWKKYVGVGGDLLYDPSKDLSNPLWDQLSNAIGPGFPLSSEGILPSSLELPLDQGSAGLQVNTAELLALQQKRTTGFSVVDIRPFFLNAVDFNCTVAQADLFSKLGINLNNNTVSSISAKSWRTVPISAAGNWLKIEALPLRGFKRPGDYNENTVAATNLVPLEIGNPNSATPLLTSGTFDMISNKLIFIQFESPQAPLIQCKLGDEFFCPFQTVYITMQTGCSAFSVITGFNAHMVQKQDHRLLAQNPAFGPGYGLWDNPFKHCIPFCFNQNNQGGASYSSRTQGTTTTDLISNILDTNAGSVTAKVDGQGLLVGWITNMDLAINTDSNNTLAAMLQVRQVNSSGTGAANRLLCSLPLMGSGPAGIGAQAAANANVNYPVPRRFTLNPGDILRATFQNANVGTLGFQWAIHGYIYGPTRTTGGGTNPTTYASVATSAEEISSMPFPADQYYIGTL